jgi:hypothetical protein
VSWPARIGELLPRAEDAYGVHEKLVDYSLKAGHPRGKAEAFARAPALTAEDLEYVAEALLRGVRTTPVSGVRPAGVHRSNCAVIVQVRGLRDRADRVANVLTAWQIRWDGPTSFDHRHIVSRVRQTVASIKHAIEEHDVVALRVPVGTWPAGPAVRSSASSMARGWSRSPKTIRPVRRSTTC